MPFSPNRTWLAILLSLTLAAALIWTGCSQTPGQGGNGDPEPPEPAPDPRYLWGIDTAAGIDQAAYTCITSNYGTPAYAGRYLTTTPGVSKGLTQAEIDYLHSQNIKILPIYNGFTNATGYQNGQQAAQNAIAAAKQLGVPAGVALFADIETQYPVDAAWLEAWITTVENASYRTGFYANPITGDFNPAYQALVNQNRDIVRDTYVWSAQPSIGVTKEANVPAYNPAEPSAPANTFIWQYGIGSTACHIDTNLLDSRLMENRLW